MTADPPRKPPVLWINLDRETQRAQRMHWALDAGQWEHERMPAIDGGCDNLWISSIPVPWRKGNRLPGIQRHQEITPARATSRAELACTASWLKALVRARSLMAAEGLEAIVIAEDDVGASFAVVDHWPFSTDELLDQLNRESKQQGTPWGLVQLAPINCKSRRHLHQIWLNSKGRQLIWPRTSMASGGAGAVLVHRRAVNQFVGAAQRLINWLARPHQLLLRPAGVRAVADKWLYGSVPEASVYLLTFPLFCLDAKNSSIHEEHVLAYHEPSKALTLDLWQRHGHQILLQAQQHWDAL